MWRSIIESIKQYLYSIGKDSDDYICILRTELEYMGILDDDGETMVYRSPDNSYIFKIDRIENVYTYEDGPQYTNIITVCNNLNIKICEMRFSEFDCVKILSSIAEFVDDAYSDDYNLEPFFIHIGFDYAQINTILRITISEYDIMPFTVKIQQYNPHLGIMADMVTMNLDYQGLADLSFMIFFQCIIDLDYTAFYQKGLERELINIEGFVIDDNSLYIQNKGGDNDVPSEYCLNFAFNNQNQTYPYGYSEVYPQTQIQQQQVISDTQIEHLTTQKRSKNTVLGLDRKSVV